MSAILERLEPGYDGIVELIYRAGSGVMPWVAPMREVARIFDSWSIQLLGANKATGVLAFSFEAGDGPAEAAVEYVRHWHRVDPRLQKSLPMAVGEWFSCEEHFDEAFVAKSDFYQEYLIPFGGRHVYGTKLHDDETMTVLLGNLTKAGKPPLSSGEKAAFRRLAAHFRKAFDIQAILAQRSDRQSVGAELLEKLRQPMILVDHQRRISYRNRNAGALLERRDLVYELDGILACRDTESDHHLTVALRELVLGPISTHGDADHPLDRRSLRLRRRDGKGIAAALIALRPESTMGAFGRTPQALFTLFEPGAPVDVDPGLLALTFGLTPSEARTAARIVNGSSPEQAARELGLKVSTIRSQLISIYGKTGAGGQADLVRLVLSATTF